MSAEEVIFYPAMIQGLENLDEPTNGANWIRPSLPDYAREVFFLQQLLGQIQKRGT